MTAQQASKTQYSFRHANHPERTHVTYPRKSIPHLPPPPLNNPWTPILTPHPENHTIPIPAGLRNQIYTYLLCQTFTIRPPPSSTHGPARPTTTPTLSPSSP